MKKALILTSFLVAALSFGAFAGPLVGLGFAPAVNQRATIHFGWQSANDWAAFITKDGLNYWYGTWGFGAAWTPELWNTVNLRAGGDMSFYWGSNGVITYKGLDLFLGAEKWITNQVGIYGQININSSLTLSPVLGLEVNFFMPSANEKPTGP